MINCPNCGSPIDVHECMCKYCETYYLDLTAFEMDSDKKYYIKFKQKMPSGENAIVTALARPYLESIESRYKAIDIVPFSSGTFNMPFHNCDITVRFSCIPDPKTGELFKEERNGQ